LSSARFLPATTKTNTPRQVSVSAMNPFAKKPAPREVMRSSKRDLTNATRGNGPVSSCALIPDNENCSFSRYMVVCLPRASGATCNDFTLHLSAIMRDAPKRLFTVNSNCCFETFCALILSTLVTLHVYLKCQHLFFREFICLKKIISRT